MPALLLILSLLALGTPPVHAGAGAPARVRVRVEDELDRLLAGLDSEDPALAREAFEALLARPGAAARAFEGWEEASAASRLARARLVAELGGVESLNGAARTCADPDGGVRRELVRFLGRPDLLGADPEAAAARVGALWERARLDPDHELRRAALEALAALDDPAAVDALDRAMDELGLQEAVVAAGLLADSGRGRERVLARVQRAFRRDPGTAPSALRSEVLAVLLSAYGPALAEVPGGVETPALRAPLVVGLAHPSVAVRSGAIAGIEGMLGRLRRLGRSDRALRVLEALEAGGLDSRLADFERLRIHLAEGQDLEPALALARSIGRERGRGMDPSLRGLAAGELEGELWRPRAVYLEALVLLALDRPTEAYERLDAAAELLDEELALRRDLWHADGAAVHVATLDDRALIEVARTVVLLAAGRGPADALVREHARIAHLLALEAQVHAVRADLGHGPSWDAQLDAPLSPLRIVFEAQENERWPLSRVITLELDLGRVLAAVSPDEVPGFRGPEGTVQGPLDDPQRLELLRRIQEERMHSLYRQRREVTEEIGRRRGLDVGVLDPRLRDRARILWFRLQEVQRERRLWDETHPAVAAGGGAAAGPVGPGQRAVDVVDVDDTVSAADRRKAERALLDQRQAAHFALDLARDLRGGGRGGEARALLERMRADVEGTGALHSTVPGLELAAQIAMTIGASWTDEDEPLAAERELTAAVERLDDFEKLLVERGASAAALERVRRMRSSALVSLAVNANVKLGDPEQALAYFEEAYELRRDDFMRVLLACYRARSGQEEEARRVLREVVPGPEIYYNLACTHALLGDVVLALDYLERELDENHPDPGARERQKAWARDDPDLASLREDPRFRWLVGLEGD